MNRQGYREAVLPRYCVLDIADEKGMFCSRLLADMGADVIRVEKPDEGWTGSSFYLMTNPGKRSITLNIEARQGQEIFKRLVEKADVVVESFPPGYIETLGLGYPQLCEINPRLVMASITGFGQSGPYRYYKSCDLVAGALGGSIYLSGAPETPPLKPSGEQTYYISCLQAAAGVLLALWHRHTTGKGQHIDISLQECVAATLDHALVRYFYQGVVAERQGGLYWNNAFRVFPCRDGHILLSLFLQWETLVELLDAEGMAGDLGDKKWLSQEYRLSKLDYIIKVLERWTLSHTVAELVGLGQSMRLAWADVASIPGLLHSPQLNDRDFFVRVESTAGERYQSPGAPCRLKRSPWQVGSRVPAPGEDNVEIYQGELGLSVEEMESLAREGVI